MPTTDLRELPRLEDATVVVPAPGDGPGNWSGAASAVLEDGTYWLAYRSRRPLTEGRGVSTVVARSDDGVHFVTVAEVRREAFGAASFERPVLLRRPDGGWRLYLSCATPDSKHWWIEALDAVTPEQVPAGTRTVVLPGSERVAVKDPVITVRDAGRAAADGEPDEPWELWLCCHPLDVVGAEDRMTTRRLVSADGLTWHDRGEVLSGTAGRWDARGARVTAVVERNPLTVLYDGRPDAASNWHETTGLARWDGLRLQPVGEQDVLRSPYGDGAFRYVCLVNEPDGSRRFYFEAARPDGAHDLYTALVAR
ncbi:hypothetical protein FHX74_002749 [Friedmanniella endophytica]|uniref:Glycosyl hydrolases family 43 n=1 Tax=Microlunatus kandeliicorticis TaxID=1759536 RepID=A0A7W3P6J8_9ACTN|nr:hypothetical protein [Microlunatus kandeliicorticis]MBA8795121.1 hypothetical protein [Microlunatus kandeliicorticis]